MFPVAGKFEIMWTDLEAASTAQGTGWGVIARTGDANPAAYASFAHTSDTLLYVSRRRSVATGVTVDHGDLETVPYAARAGGTATPIAGATRPTYNEYYPTFSPDDRYVAYNRVPNGQSSYNNAQRRGVRDPGGGRHAGAARGERSAAAAGKTSPGVTNSWPKWAPGRDRRGTASATTG